MSTRNLIVRFLILLSLILIFLAPVGRLQTRAQALPVSAPASPAAATATTGKPITYYSVTPLTLDPNHDESVQIRVEADASVDDIRLVLKGGTQLPFSNQGQGVFTLTLSSTVALAGYDPAHDVHRHWAGNLHVFSNGVKLAQYLMIFNVADADIPNVPLVSLAPDVQASPHLVNIRLGAYFPDAGATAITGRPSPTTQLTNRFYDFFGDDYDFLVLLQEPSQFANRHYIGVRNDIAGIGLTLFDSSADYGSAGRLQGVVYYPLSTYYDPAEQTFSHELGHRWLVFLKQIDKLLGIGPHWPVSSLASGIMGYNTMTSTQGLRFPFTVAPVGDGSYILQPAENKQFNDMELYLMGLMPAEDVGEHVVFVDQDQTLCTGCILYGPVNLFHVSDIIDTYGPREPAYPNAQTEFRVAAIFVTRDRLLSPREMAFFDYFTSRAEATQPMAHHIGASWGVDNPFYLATDGLAAMHSRLVWAASPLSALYLPMQMNP